MCVFSYILGLPDKQLYHSVYSVLYLSYVPGLPDKQLYPSVSAVYGNTEVSMVYLGPPLDG